MAFQLIIGKNSHDVCLYNYHRGVRSHGVMIPRERAVSPLALAESIGARIRAFEKCEIQSDELLQSYVSMLGVCFCGICSCIQGLEDTFFALLDLTDGTCWNRSLVWDDKSAEGSARVKGQ